MNRQVCKYSIIRFQPFVETEEFANIGIVLYEPTTRQLRFKLLSAKEHKRVSDFFDPLKKEIYVAAIQIIQAELERIQGILANSVVTKMDFYEELIRPREDIVQFSKNRVLFGTDLNKTMDELFEHYVKRSFAYRETHEEEMRKRIRELLKGCGLDGRFKEGYLGNKEQYNVHLPFVNESRKAAIKPIHFTHPDSSKLIEHGLSWLMKIQQLKRCRFIEPQNILFTYQAPEHQHGVLLAAFNDVKHQIEDAGILMSDINKAQDITHFVQSQH